MEQLPESKFIFFKYVCLIFVNNQLDAQFFFMHVYFYSLHVSGSHVPIIRRINCINMTYIQSYIPDVALIQLILLIMGTWLPETCRA
jgi:hypothetical protein